jgi:phosphonate degradation associated HDIG domain protein
MAVPTIDDLRMLFFTRGAEQYDGEPVTHLEHALQAAHLAEQADASDELVTACLLHDIGHLLTRRQGTPTLEGIDDTHQRIGAMYLRGLFGPLVVESIRLHVEAKRYLCAVDPSYHARLSEDSRRSLRLQGGVFSEEQAQTFILQATARQAVSVRVWDDLAKQPGLRTPSLEHFLERAARCAIGGPDRAAA